MVLARTDFQTAPLNLQHGASGDSAIPPFIEYSVDRRFADLTLQPEESNPPTTDKVKPNRYAHARPISSVEIIRRQRLKTGRSPNQ
jgi:hypothetical protein